MWVFLIAELMGSVVLGNRWTSPGEGATLVAANKLLRQVAIERVCTSVSPKWLMVGEEEEKSQRYEKLLSLFRRAKGRDNKEHY